MNEPRITPISLRFGGTSPKVADAFLEKIMKQCQQLAQFPRMGRERENLAPKLRSFPVAKFVIFYRPADDTVEIIRVLYAARDIESVFEAEPPAEEK